MMATPRKPLSWIRIQMIGLLLASGVIWVAIYGVGAALMFWPESGGFDRQLATFGEGLRKVAATRMDGTNLQSALKAVDVVIAEFAASGGGRGAGGARSSEVLQSDGQPAKPKNGAVGFNIWLNGETWLAGSRNVPRQRARKVDLNGFYRLVLEGVEYRAYSIWTADRRLRIDVLQPYDGQWTDFNDVMLSPASIVAPLLVGFPLLLLPVLIVMKCGLKPLRELATKLAKRRPDDLQPVHVDDLLVELQPVVDEVNGTLGKLDALLKRERDFLADAAHELRTPLAVISAQADEVLGAATPEARSEAVGGLRVGLDRANRLVNQLLVLARLEARADDADGPADAADIVRDCLAAYAREAREKAIQLAYRGPDHVPIAGAGHALESIVSNLVGNAVRYGKPGGQVVVRMDADEATGALVLSVCDDGPGIPAAERTRIFERFRRGSQLGASGSGLGLAIVASAARQFGARVDVGEGIGGQGVCFALSWNARDIPASAGGR